MKFNEVYKSAADRRKYLEGFDFINLKKAAKIGKITTSHITNKQDLIKKILAFDIKNKYLICKTIYENQEEYGKPKIDDVAVIKTRELEAARMKKSDLNKGTNTILLEKTVKKVESTKSGKTKTIKLDTKEQTQELDSLKTSENELQFKIYKMEDLALMLEAQLNVIADMLNIPSNERSEKTRLIAAIIKAQSSDEFLKRKENANKKFKGTNPVKPLEQKGYVIKGIVSEVKSQVYKIQIIQASEKVAIGSSFEATLSNGETRILEVSEIINDKLISAFVLGPEEGLAIGQEVRSKNQPYSIQISSKILGRVIDPIGRILDDPKHKLDGKQYAPLYVTEVNQKDRYKIIPKTELLETGIKVIDLLIPIAKGYCSRIN